MISSISERPCSSTNTSGIARAYSVCRQERHHRYLFPKVLQCLERLPTGSRVLDLGCGSGYLSGELHRKGYRVTGVELSETGVAVARAALPDCEFQLGSATDPEIARLTGGDFAAVVAVEVIEHLYSPRAFLRNARQLLAPDGILVLTTPYHGYLKNLILAASGRLETHFQPGCEGGHIKFWCRATLTRVLREERFQPVSFCGGGRIPYLWKSMVVSARPIRD